MIRRIILAAVCAVLLSPFATTPADAQQRAFGRIWGSGMRLRDWERFYYYPYVYYPHNFWGNNYYRSSESLYHRYPQEMRTPVYNKKWHNYYPNQRPYHSGHQFILDVF